MLLVFGAAAVTANIVLMRLLDPGMNGRCYFQSIESGFCPAGGESRKIWYATSSADHSRSRVDSLPGKLRVARSLEWSVDARVLPALLSQKRRNSSRRATTCETRLAFGQCEDRFQ